MDKPCASYAAVDFYFRIGCQSRAWALPFFTMIQLLGNNQ